MNDNTLMVMAALVRHYAHLRIKCLARYWYGSAGQWNSLIPIPRRNLAKVTIFLLLRSTRAAPRLASLGQRDTDVGSDSSSSCGDTGGGREAAGLLTTGVISYSVLLIVYRLLCSLLVTLYLMRLRRLSALTNAFSLTMKKSRPIFVFLMLEVLENILDI